MSDDVFVLGGYQTDFARNYSRENKDIAALMEDAVEGALERLRASRRARSKPPMSAISRRNCSAIRAFSAACLPRSGRNFPGCRRAVMKPPAPPAVWRCWAPPPTSRPGVTVSPACSASNTCAMCRRKSRANISPSAARAGHEFRDATYVWPRAFSDLIDVYDERYGIDYRHISRISEINLENGKRNPNAQTRKWIYGPKSFTEDDEANPRIEGRVRRNDCAQVTDGAAAIFLASRDYAERWARRRNVDLDSVPRILGWGHRSATIMFKDKIAESRDKPYVFPHLRDTIDDAFRRAGVADVFELDAIETHDCFAITEYMAIDHFGITAPGEAWKAVEDGTVAFGGKLPVNPSGGLIGLGHPVGATGVRMVLDAAKQVTGDAGDYQVEGARKVATLNIGGTATTSCCFVVGN